MVHGGYFGADNLSTDESIQQQVNEILIDKQRLLSFKDDKGQWITRRFLFSKWTLREGWDNPNVFVIAKLRTSGSENSKIQEVGRGLRLPVDETGSRIHDDSSYEPRLAFLIGYDEREFAKTLVGEINSDIKIDLSVTQLTTDMIMLVVAHQRKSKPNYSDEDLLNSLDRNKIINRKNEFLDEVEIDGIKKSGYEWFSELHPEIYDVRLKDGKVVEQGQRKTNKTVKLRKENWSKVKNLWENFSKRYMIEFVRSENQIETVIIDVLSNKNYYDREIVKRAHETFKVVGNKVEQIIREEGVGKIEYRQGLPYGVFLKSLSESTSLPVNLLHNNLFDILKKEFHGNMTYLSETTLRTLTREFKERINEVYSQLYEYNPLDFVASTSIYDASRNDFVDEISTGLIGVHKSSAVIDESRDLYERPPVYFDSIDPEKMLLEHGYDDSIIAFGKIPKNAIRVPKYVGGSTTPDFLYVVEKEEGNYVYLIVETKAENMRESDRTILEIQKKFFDKLGRNVQYLEAVNENEVYSKLRVLLEDSKNETN